MQEVTTLPKNSNIAGKINSIMAKLAAHPFLLALLFNFAAFLFRILVFDVKYEVSDDYITDAVLSGAYGNGYDPDLLFGNVILGYFLVFLYKIIPTISFYFVMLIVLGFISATTITYILFKKKVNTITVCMAIVFLCFTTDDFYVLIQFTKVAAAAGIAGGLLILYAMFEAGEHKIRYFVLGTLLTIVGSMVRFSAIYIFAPFLVVTFLFYAVVFLTDKEHKDKSGSNKEAAFFVMKRFIVCVLVIGSLYGLQYLGTFISNLDEGHREFNHFHDIRSQITDTGIPEFELIEMDYKSLGYDYVDYVMLNSWAFDDRGVYSDEDLINVGKINKIANSGATVNLGVVFRIFTERMVFSYPVAFAMLINVLLGMALSKKKLFPVLLVLANFVMLAGFVFYGRTMYRVEWSVYFCAAASAVTTFSYDENSPFAKLRRNLFGKERNMMGVYTGLLVLLLLFARVPRAVTSYIFLNCSDGGYRTAFDSIMLHSGEFLPTKAGFPTVKRKPTPNLVDYIENDSEHYYYLDFATCIQSIYYDYDPWIRPDEGLFCDNYAYFGGCTMHHPGEAYALEANGIDPENPFKSLTDENVYIVDDWAYVLRLAYIRKYYDKTACARLVNVIDGHMIWNYYIPDANEVTDGT